MRAADEIIKQERPQQKIMGKRRMTKDNLIIAIIRINLVKCILWPIKHKFGKKLKKIYIISLRPLKLLRKRRPGGKVVKRKIIINPFLLLITPLLFLFSKTIILHFGKVQ